MKRSKQKWKPLNHPALYWPFESPIFVCSTHTGRLSCGARAGWTRADLAALHLDVMTGRGAECIVSTAKCRAFRHFDPIIVRDIFNQADFAG